ncbi:hypothetical protein, partial [Parafilimonas sp.]|uniref:hypothetical protein n=1 Tax=Parafilimonas sp. TaxID=1969739 RepID=UPI0039E4A954
MKTIGYTFMLLSVYNCAYANLGYSDSTTIVCIFRAPDKPTESYFIPGVRKWKADFSKSTPINSAKKINDSTWELKIATPTNNFNQLYSLGLIGPTYEVFLDNKPEKQLLLIDSTTDDNRKPYKISPGIKNKFSFGIEWQNATENYPVPTDSADNSNQINKILQQAGNFKYKYRQEIAQSEAFASFVNIQILRTLYDRIWNPYAETAAGKFLKDSLRRVLESAVRKPIVFSFNSTQLGSSLLLENKGNKSNYITSIQEAVSGVHSNLYSDFLIFSNFKKATYAGISMDEIKEIFKYSKSKIKDPELSHSLEGEFQLYVNAHQPLPENIMLKTQLKDSSDNVLSMKQLMTSLMNKGKQKIVVD